MDNPDKLATHVTQDEENQIKNTTQYVLDTTTYNVNIIYKAGREPTPYW